MVAENENTEEVQDFERYLKIVQDKYRGANDPEAQAIFEKYENSKQFKDWVKIQQLLSDLGKIEDEDPPPSPPIPPKPSPN